MTINIIERLSVPPAIEDIGEIPCPELFSEILTHVYYGDRIDINLPVRNGDFDFSVMPPQFQPAAHMARDHHRRKGISAEHARIDISQGWLTPGKNLRTMHKHFDALPKTYPETDYANNDCYLVSDGLCTRFMQQAYIMPPDIQLDKDNHVLSHVFELQTNPEKILTAKPYHMMNFDSFTVHEAQKAPEAMSRTFFMIRFF